MTRSTGGFDRVATCHCVDRQHSACLEIDHSDLVLVRQIGIHFLGPASGSAAIAWMFSALTQISPICSFFVVSIMAINVYAMLALRSGLASRKIPVRGRLGSEADVNIPEVAGSRIGAFDSTLPSRQRSYTLFRDAIKPDLRGFHSGRWYSNVQARSIEDAGAYAYGGRDVCDQRIVVRVILLNRADKPFAAESINALALRVVIHIVARSPRLGLSQPLCRYQYSIRPPTEVSG